LDGIVILVLGEGIWVGDARTFPLGMPSPARKTWMAGTRLALGTAKLGPGGPAMTRERPLWPGKHTFHTEKAGAPGWPEPAMTERWLNPARHCLH
jgi:hypothetical protein